MSTIYGAIKIDKSKATKGGNIESIRSTVLLENGMVVIADTLVANEREARTVAQITTADLLNKSLMIHASVPTTYNAGDTIVNFALQIGRTGRAIIPTVGDIFTVTDSMITGTSVLNQYLIPANASYKLVPSATDAGTTRFVAKVIEKGTSYGLPSTTYEIVKC